MEKKDITTKIGNIKRRIKTDTALILGGPTHTALLGEVETLERMLDRMDKESDRSFMQSITHSMDDACSVISELWSSFAVSVKDLLKTIKGWFAKVRPVCVDCRFLTKIQKLIPSSDTYFDCCTHELHREPVDGSPSTCYRFNESPETYAKCPYFKERK